MIDIAFWVLVTTCVVWIIWELLPDYLKEYLKYLRAVRRDKKEGKKGRYSFSFRIATKSDGLDKGD